MNSATHSKGKMKRKWTPSHASCKIPYDSIGFLLSCQQGQEKQAAIGVKHLIHELLEDVMFKDKTKTKVETHNKEHKKIENKDSDASPHSDSEKAIGLQKSADACLREELDQLANIRNHERNEKRGRNEKLLHNEIMMEQGDVKHEHVNLLLVDYDTGVKGLAFVRTSLSSSKSDSQLVSSLGKVAEDILETAKATGRCFSQKVIKVLPICSTCHADIESLRKCASKALAPTFTLKDEKKNDEFSTKMTKRCTFGVVYEHRNGNIERNEVIDAVAKLVDDKVHRVDLKNPDIVIVIQDLRSCFGISMLPRYYDLKKYNMRSMSAAHSPVT